jgi:hypothetical protein
MPAQKSEVGEKEFASFALVQKNRRNAARTGTYDDLPFLKSDCYDSRTRITGVNLAAILSAPEQM